MGRPSRLLRTSIAFVLCLGACTAADDPGVRRGDASPAASPAAVRGGTIDFGILGEPATLDPYARDASDLTYALVRPVYPSLFRLGPDGAPYPDLADSIERRGGGVVVTLKDAHWSNGREIDARDVEASAERARPPSGFASVRARRVGARSVVFSGDVDDWELTLARLSFVLPRGRARQRISGGPLRIVKRVPGLKIVYRRNPGWGRVDPQRVRVFHFHDSGSMREMVTSGDIDAAAIPSTVNLADRIDDAVDLHRAVGWESVWLDLANSGLSGDARRAVAARIDREALAEGFVRDDGRVSNNLQPQPGPTGAEGSFRAPAGSGDVPDFALAVPQGDELLTLVQRAVQLQLAPVSRVDLVALDVRRFYGRPGRLPAARLVRSAGAPGRSATGGASTGFGPVPLFHVATFVLSKGLEGIVVNPTFDGPLWNVERWRLTEAS